VSPIFSEIRVVYLWKYFILPLKRYFLPDFKKCHHFSFEKMVTFFKICNFVIFLKGIILFFKDIVAKAT